MPLPHATLANFYARLAQQLAAGLTFAQALRASSEAPADDTHRLAALAESGLSIPEILDSAGDWLPVDDRPFLAAAARSGRLPRILQNLSERHARIAATRRRILLASLYPLAVFHLGAVVLPFLRLIDFETGLRWSLPAYLGGVLAIVLPAWLLVIGFRILVRRQNPLALAIADRLPAIGGYRRHQTLADFAFALGNLLEGGAPIDRAWVSAGAISRSPRIAAAARAIAAHIDVGDAPGPRLARTRAFPATFVARYQTGETTGSLDNALLSLAAEHQAAADARLAVASMLYPGLLFAAVAVMIAWIVISFALQYYGRLDAIMNGM